MKVRPTARLIILDDQDRVLLFKYEDKVALDPTRPDLRVYWGTPGGGLETGETFAQAARRELWEEMGIQGVDLDPPIWARERELHFPDGPVFFQEQYFLVRVVTGEVSWANLEAYERQVCREHRWWSLEELRTSGEVFLPPGLADLLEPILAGALPDQPLQLDVPSDGVAVGSEEG